MDLQPKTEPGFASPPVLDKMNISELVKVLRTAYLVEDFDRVEEVLVAREARIKAESEEKMKEIGCLREQIERERAERLHVGEQLRKCTEQAQKGKRSQEDYQTLLKAVKKGGVDDKKTINELRNRIRELEDENRKHEDLMKNWLDDNHALDELKIINRKLEDEKLELEAEQKKWRDEKKTIDKLTAENRKLTDEKGKIESLLRAQAKKFEELHERVLRLEKDADVEVPFEVKNEPKEINENVGGRKFGSDTADTADTASKPTKVALGASAGGMLGLKNVIELDDSDDDVPISQRAVQQRKLQSGKSINTLDRPDTDTSSCSSHSFNFDDLPLSCRSIISNKKRKTWEDSPGLNTLPR